MGKKTSIEELPEALIFEILVRILPDLRSLALCKCVSKQWLNLIISTIHNPNLAHRLTRWFLITKASRDSKFSIISNGDDVDSDIDFLINKSSNLISLDFLSARYQANPFILATYKDLILCKLNWLYCVCNPYTKQWVILPQPPTNVHEQTSYGLITHHDHENNNSYFSVVCLIQSNKYHQKPVHRFEVEIFSSKFGKWRKVQILCPKDSHVYNFKGDASCPGVACNGMLYWPTLNPNGVGFVAGFVGIDPFKMFTNDCCNDYQHYCRFIGLPKDFYWATCDWNLGVCNDQLRFCSGVYYGNLHLDESKSSGYSVLGDKQGLSVWELEDDNNGTSSSYKWNLVQWMGYKNIVFDILKDRSLGGLLEGGQGLLYFDVFAVDPNDSGILYIRTFDLYIAFYNLRKRTIGILTSIKHESNDSHHQYLQQQTKPSPFCGIFWPFCLSLCPTPLPPIHFQTP